MNDALTRFNIEQSWEATTTEPMTHIALAYSPYSYEVLNSCVLYIKSKGVKVGGDAVFFTNFPSKPPVRGGVVVLKYTNSYHVAYIERLLDTGVWVSETNYKKGQYTERFVSFADPHIVQFWSDR